MSLCALCSALTISKLYPPNIYHHGANVAALKQSGESCQLCKLIHWSLSRASEAEHHPQLHFEGALDDLIPYGERKERDKCSIKLQIITQAWNEKFEMVETNEIFKVGIWMKSKYMIADFALVVEEGIAACVSVLTLH